MSSLPTVAALALLVSGCAGTPPTPFHKRAPVLPPEARELVMVDGESGDDVSWEQLVERARGVDVVLIGETHGHPQGLAAAAFLFDELLADDSLHPALALEFFTRDQQLGLEDYLSKVTTESGMVKALRLTHGNYPDGHRAMVRAARKAEAPVWAANAPRRYVSLSRKRGYPFLQELGPLQAQQFVVPESLTEGDYRDRFEELMTHDDEPPTPEKLTAVFRSQNLWDATMADSVVRSVRAGGVPTVLVVGHFHVGFDGGTKQRVRDAEPERTMLTLTFLDETSDVLRDEDKGRADVVIYAGAFPEE